VGESSEQSAVGAQRLKWMQDRIYTYIYISLAYMWGLSEIANCSGETLTEFIKT